MTLKRRASCSWRIRRCRSAFWGMCFSLRCTLLGFLLLELGMQRSQSRSCTCPCDRHRQDKPTAGNTDQGDSTLTSSSSSGGFLGTALQLQEPKKNIPEKPNKVCMLSVLKSLSLWSYTDGGIRTNNLSVKDTFKS